jgi:stringent starvation protein B
MAPTARLPPKKDVALALLEQASMYIHLDPRAEAVQVPAWFKKQPQLVLQVGLNMAVPIPDLHVDEQGLSCTLSFNRAPFFCMIPWPAVFALVGENGQAMVWAEDVPAEVAAQAQAQKAPEKPRPHLRSVGEGETAAKGTDKLENAAQPPAAEKKPATKASKADKPSSAQPTKRAVKVTAKAKPTGKAVAKAAPQKTSTKAPAEKLRANKKTPVAVSPAAKPEAATPRPMPVPAKKAAQPKPEAARASAESSKPKRELPPYLRVVK